MKARPQLPKSTRLVLAAWLVLGPVVGTVISFITGQSLLEEIVLSTVGGLVGGFLYGIAFGGDHIPAALWVLVGAVGTILLYDAVKILGVLEVTRSTLSRP